MALSGCVSLSSQSECLFYEEFVQRIAGVCPGEPVSSQKCQHITWKSSFVGGPCMHERDSKSVVFSMLCDACVVIERRRGPLGVHNLPPKGQHAGRTRLSGVHASVPRAGKNLKLPVCSRGASVWSLRISTRSNLLTCSCRPRWPSMTRAMTLLFLHFHVSNK